MQDGFGGGGGGGGLWRGIVTTRLHKLVVCDQEPMLCSYMTQDIHGTEILNNIMEVFHLLVGCVKRPIDSEVI